MTFRDASQEHQPISTGKYKYRIGTSMVPSAEYLVHFDDFDKAFIPGTAITNGEVAYTPTNGWQGAIIDTGGTVALITTATTGANGVLKFNSDDASEGSAIYGQKSLQLISGKKFWMECRMQTDDITDNNFLFGLTSLTATTNPEDLYSTTATDLISFGLGDGDSNPKMLSDKSNSGTSFQIQTVKGMSANTWHVLAIGWDGNKLRGYVDGKEALTWSGATSTTVPLAVALAPFISHVNGNGGGNNTCLVDYIRWVSER